MKKYKLKKLLFLLILFTPNILFVSEASASGFGAEIFCTMRTVEMIMKAVGKLLTVILKNKGRAF